MKIDLFCSIAHTPVDGVLPSEATMLSNFLAQCSAADELGYGTVWVAESHYSTKLQQRHPEPVVPHWQGEIGLNNDICQLAAHVFARTRRLDVGSAIMNVICNGGPLPAAERVATALAWHGLDPGERRRLRIGFAAGRFDYINRLTGVVPRTEWERAAWPQVRNAVMWEAGEIFVRLLAGEELSSAQIAPVRLTAAHFRDAETWQRVRDMAGATGDELPVPRRWEFDVTKVIPADVRRDLLCLYVGSHDPALQTHLNAFAPVRTLNLSITPAAVLEATHERMRAAYHPAGGSWRRGYLPRTTFVFLNARPGLGAERRRAAAREEAEHALAAYWSAMDGTIDPAKVASAADNALVGNPDDVAAQLAERFHPDDRVMLWFDFFNHDNDRVIENMTALAEEVMPRLDRLGVPVSRA
ncbi:MAG TPA: LLM class flavin-dependent oxidoreductase [Pilimelia sp.]|nr:LLM class flavin-dependent oxidoreductase [Pilimelia sp.]